MASSVGKRRADLAIAAALLLFGAALVPILRMLLGLTHPAGGDTDLWGLYALNTPLGTPSAVPPAFPALVYGIHAVAGLLPVPAAGLAAALGAALVPPVAYLLARALGARRPLAASAAVLAMTMPHASAVTLQAQPDTWVMLLLLGGALAVLAVDRWPGILGSSLLVVVAGTAPLWRSHGLVLAAVLLCLAVLLRGRLPWRAARVVGIAAVLLLAPAVLGQRVALPWEQPWFARVSNAGTELTTGGVPSHAVRLQASEEEKERLAGYYHDGARFRLVLYHAGRALGRAPVAWAFVAAGLALYLVRGRGARRLAAVAGLAPVLPALVVWSDPRHVAVALPVSLAACAAGLHGLSPRRRWAGLALAAALWSGSHWAWPGVAGEIRTQAAGNAALEEIGTDLCALASPGDLAAGDLKAFLYCPLPLAPLGDPAADWRIWWVTRAPPIAEGWVRVPTRSPRLYVHRYHAEIAGSERPCQDSVPPVGSPYIALQPISVTLDPPCAPEGTWLAGLPPAPEELQPGQQGTMTVPDPAGIDSLEERERRERARPGGRRRSVP